jgi:type I restriction enzyme S subunit
MLPSYLYWYLLSETGGRRQLTNAAYGAGKPGLNLENIRSVSIPVPPIEKQQEIVSLIGSCADAERDLNVILSQESRRATSLRLAILKRAFSGQLVLQDPNDEPASALLERIRSEQAESSLKTKKRKPRTKREAA